MKLQRLAGYGPVAAIAGGAALLLALALIVLGPAVTPTFNLLAGLLVFVVVVAISLWLLSLLVVGLDLEWLEHPATHTGRLRVSLWLMVVAAAMIPLFGLLVAGASETGLPAMPLAVIGFCTGFFLVVQNLEARRAGLLAGVLPWLGIVAGICFLVMAFGFLLGMAAAAFFVLASLGWFAGAVTSAGWMIWLGVRLRGANPLPTAVGTPA